VKWVQRDLHNSNIMKGENMFFKILKWFCIVILTIIILVLGIGVFVGAFIGLVLGLTYLLQNVNLESLKNFIGIGLASICALLIILLCGIKAYEIVNFIIRKIKQIK
jgi:uncharacterized membrane protein